MALNVGYLTAERNEESNEKYTPYYAVKPLLKYIPKTKKIWCPFDQEWSAFYKTFKNSDYDVVRSSIQDGQDFFDYEPDEYDVIISNPPYTKKVEVLKRLDELEKPFAMLLPIATIQGIKQFDYLKDIQILSFDKRIAFHNPESMQKYQKGVSFATAYFCKGILPKDLIIERIEEYEKPLVKQPNNENEQERE